MENSEEENEDQKKMLGIIETIFFVVRRMIDINDTS